MGPGYCCQVPLLLYLLCGCFHTLACAGGQGRVQSVSMKNTRWGNWRKLGRHLAGKPFNLYYEGEYREDDADMEPCFPIRKAVEVEGVSVRELPGGRCVSLLHKGPYDELGRSYEKILAYIREEERLKNTRVIILSADEIQTNFLSDQADIALVKPVGFYQLRDVVKNLFPELG